jgi:hypothetical protein
MQVYDLQTLFSRALGVPVSDSGPDHAHVAREESRTPWTAAYRQLTDGQIIGASTSLPAAGLAVITRCSVLGVPAGAAVIDSAATVNLTWA